MRVQNPLEQLSIEQLRQRTSAKWHYYPADVLPMWVAEMDVPLAEPIAQGLRHAVEIGDTGYAAGHAYAHALKDFAAARWGWDGFPADSAKSVPDVMMGIVEVLRLISEPGDPVVVNCPVYPPFYAFVTHAGRRVVESPLTEEGRIDLHRLEDTFRALNRAVYLLSSPHNPTGAVHTREELTAVAGLARTYGVRVIVDEIHAPLALPGAQFVPYLSVPGSEDAFSVLSASKAWNLAGLKAALAVAGPEAQSDLDSTPEEVAHGASRTLLARLLGEHLPAIRWRTPDATYLAWLDARALGLHDEGSAGPGVVSELEGPARYFLDQARVALSSGHVFGTGGSGHVRLNFATSQANLLEGLERMATALTRLPGVRH